MAQEVEGDSDAHSVPLLNEYTIQLFQVLGDSSEEIIKSRLTLWHNIESLLASLTSSSLRVISTNHPDLVEVILNSISIDTFECSSEEWNYTCSCLRSLLKGCGANFWNVVPCRMSDIFDDILEIVSLQIPLANQFPTASVQQSSNKSIKDMHGVIITGFNMLSDLVGTSDDFALTQIEVILNIIKEVTLKKFAAFPAVSWANEVDHVELAICTFTLSLIKKEHQALMTVNISSPYGSTLESRTIGTEKFNTVKKVSHFLCRLCDIASVSTMGVIKIQSVLLESAKWIGTFSEEYLHMTDRSFQTSKFKLHPLIAQQHQGLGELVTSINVKHSDRKTTTISTKFAKVLKSLLSHVPYCLVSFNSHLKSATLHMFQNIVELLTSRCCHSRSWANPMQVLDPLIESETFVTVNNSGASHKLVCTSSIAFNIIVESCTSMSEYLNEKISSVARPPATVDRSIIAESRRSASASDAVCSNSDLMTTPTLVRAHSVIKHKKYLEDELLNILFAGAITGVFSFYERLRVILHSAYLQIGTVMNKNSHKSPHVEDSVISWQELWCMEMPIWEEHLRRLKSRRSLFKNGIVPEVSSLPAAPHLISSKPKLVDLTGDEESPLDPMTNYVNILTSNINKKTNNGGPNFTGVNTPAATNASSRSLLGSIPSSSKISSANANSVNSKISKDSKKTIVKIDLMLNPACKSSVSSVPSKKHVVKGGAMSLREQIRSKIDAERQSNKCVGVDDYMDELEYEIEGSRDTYQPHRGVPQDSVFYNGSIAGSSSNRKSYNSYRDEIFTGITDLRKKKRVGHVNESANINGETTKTKTVYPQTNALKTSEDSGEVLDEGIGAKKVGKVNIAPDITSILASSATCSSIDKVNKHTDSSAASRSKDIPLLMSQKSIEDSNLTMMQKLANVNIDDFYLRLLKLPLDKQLPRPRDLDKCPVRFNSEAQYIKFFQPLLEAELDQMLSESILTNCASSRNHERQMAQPGVYGQKTSSSSASLDIPKVFVRCAMIQPRTAASAAHLNANSEGLQFKNVDTTLHACHGLGSSSTDYSSTASLEEVRVAVVDSDRALSRSYGPPSKLNRDDLVVILDSNSIVGDLNNYSMKDFLVLPHCLAVVVSQHSGKSPVRESGMTDGGANLGQQSLVVLKDATPPSSSTWICVPFVSLTTNTREWKALHSIRSHSLLPLVPYLLQAAPIVSASRLQCMYRDLERGLCGIVQTESRDKDKLSASELEMSTKTDNVLLQLRKLSLLEVDISVLAVTDMPNKMKSLIKRKCIYREKEVLKSLKDILSKWKNSVKTNNKLSTIEKLKGGNVITASSIRENKKLLAPPSTVPTALWKVLANSHNPDQLFAVKYVVSSIKDDEAEKENDTRICLIQGPPGTGKTRTILAMIATLLSLQHHCKASTEKFSSSCAEKVPTNRLLVCAPSNAAVDEVLLRLMTDGVVGRDGKIRKPLLVRLGKHTEGSTQAVIDITLENQVEKYLQRDSAWKKLQKAMDAIAQLKLQLSGIETKGESSTERRRKLRSDLRKEQASKILAEKCVLLRRSELRKKLLETCDVLAGTLSAAGQYTILDHVKQYDIRFETVLIDEAAQATEPATLIPLRYGCKTLVLVGDPRQLPAYVASAEAKSAGLGKSLFERLEQAGHAVVMLSVQYRMHPSISAFPSKQFYGGKLRDAHRILVECGILEAATSINSGTNLQKKSKSRVTTPLCRQGSPDHLSPAMLFDIQGKEELAGKSFKNRVEAEFIFTLLDALRNVPCVQTYQIGILSPYKSQVNFMKSCLNPYTLNGSASNGTSTSYGHLLKSMNIEVNTIDGFQGREKDIILLSTVRCNTRNVSFISDERRLNVAITRAKRCLIIVGSADTLRQDTVWRSCVEMLRQANSLVPGPRSGNFQDYQGYRGIMSTVRHLIENDDLLESDASKDKIENRDVATSNIHLQQDKQVQSCMKRTRDMIEKQQSVSNCPPVLYDRNHGSYGTTIHRGNDYSASSLEEGEVEDFELEPGARPDNLIAKKKRR